MAEHSKDIVIKTTEEHREDLQGGTYGNITVSGSAVFCGTINCEKLEADGCLTAETDICAKTISLSGTARIEGLLQAEDVTIFIGHPKGMTIDAVRAGLLRIGAVLKQ